MEIPSVRVLVVGDSGVGKTTLLRAICRDPSEGAAAAPQHRWTTGCDVHVLLHQYRETYGVEKEVYVEFIDVGGHPKYEISRAMFYHDVQGAFSCVIFMHDLSNARSYDHLKAWYQELVLVQRMKGCVVPPLPSARSGEFPSLHELPKLVIGNKRDTIKPHAKRPNSLPELRTVDTIESSAEPFVLDTLSFHGFLDRVVAFANSSSSHNSNSAFGDAAHTGSASGYLSPFFSEGLRQMKSKPQSPHAPLSSGGPPLSSGGGSVPRSWWK